MQSFKTDKNDFPLNKNSVIRIAIVISIMFILAAIHLLRVGTYFKGDLYIYYYSYASDLMLPFGAYFLLCMNEIYIRFLQKWYVKVVIVFMIITFSEIMQYFGIYFFGDTFDLIDILMYGIGTFTAAFFDRQILERFVPLWRDKSLN